MRTLIIDHENLAIAKAEFAGLRANAQPIANGDIAEINKKVGCCKRTKPTYIGQIKVIEGANPRFKTLEACPVCKQLLVDNNKRPITGDLGDYLERLIKKHDRVEFIIENEKFLQLPKALAAAS